MNSLPIIYLDREDLKVFLSNGNANEEGVSYEWEDERVIHIKMKPYNHSFGKTGRVLFTLGGSNAENDANRPLWESGKYSFVVYVNNFKPPPNYLSMGICIYNIMCQYLKEKQNIQFYYYKKRIEIKMRLILIQI